MKRNIHEDIENLMGDNNKNMKKPKDICVEVPPPYGKAVEDNEDAEKHMEDTMKEISKEAEGITAETPTTGEKKVKTAYTEKLNLSEGLFEMNEDVSSNEVADVAKFLKNAVEGLVIDMEGCWTYKLDNRLAICVGWQDGYAENDDSVIHAADNKSWAIVAGIKVWTSDDMRTDYDYINYPYYEDGDVLDNDVSISPNEDYEWLATDLLDTYDGMKNLNIEEDGKIVGEDDQVVEESVKLDEDKDANPLEGIRSNVLEFPSGDYLYVGYEDGKLFAGSATNTGVIHEYEIEYDWDENVDSNIERLYDTVAEQHPEFLDECLKEDAEEDKKENGDVEMKVVKESKKGGTVGQVEGLPNDVYTVVYDKLFPRAARIKRSTIAPDVDVAFDEDRYIASARDWDIGVAVVSEDEKNDVQKVADFMKLKTKFTERNVDGDDVIGVIYVLIDDDVAEIQADEYLKSIGVEGSSRLDKSAAWRYGGDKYKGKK